MLVLLYMGLSVMLWIWTKILFLGRAYSPEYGNNLWAVCTMLHFSQFLWRTSCNQYTFSICLYNLNWETDLLRWRTRAFSLGKLMCEGGKELAAWVGCVGQHWKAEVWVMIDARMGKHIKVNSSSADLVQRWSSANLKPVSRALMKCWVPNSWEVLDKWVGTPPLHKTLFQVR